MTDKAMDRDGNKMIIHCCIEKDVYEMLIKHCDATGQTKTTAIKRAIREYCGRYTDDARREEIERRSFESGPESKDENNDNSDE